MKLADCQKVADTYEALVAAAYEALHSGDSAGYRAKSDAAVRMLPEAATAYWFKERTAGLPEFHKDPAWVPPSDLNLSVYCNDCGIRQDYHCPGFQAGTEPDFCRLCRRGRARHCSGFQQWTRHK